MTNEKRWPWVLPERKANCAGNVLYGIESTPALIHVLSKALKERRHVAQDDTKFFTMPSEEAVLVLETFLKHENGSDCDSTSNDTATATASVPLIVIRAAATLLLQQQSEPADHMELCAAVALSTKLVFSKTEMKPIKTEEETRRFQKRMDRLRLRDEESRYKALTGNIRSYVPQDVTVKSMTYAASVGLNMIVAPISFGVFMYFFAGQFFSWISATPHVVLRPNEVDIRRVITGVVSGVGMLFIEMILFVIRTHTIDKSSRKKAKQMETVSPFGYAKPNAPTVLSQGTTTIGSSTNQGS